MYGLKSEADDGSLLPAKKPTGFLTSSWAIAEELSRRCSGTHIHQPLIGDRAGKAAIYPEELQKAICRGPLKQKAYEHYGVATSRSVKVQTLASVMKAAGITKRSEKEVPTHWVDMVHEDDVQRDSTGKQNAIGESMNVLFDTGGRLTAWDDVTGAELDTEEVEKARKTEMD